MGEPSAGPAGAPQLQHLAQPEASRRREVLVPRRLVEAVEQVPPAGTAMTEDRIAAIEAQNLLGPLAQLPARRGQGLRFPCPVVNGLRTVDQGGRDPDASVAPAILDHRRTNPPELRKD